MKLCMIYNSAPRYREAVYRKIDTTFDCDWFFGPTTAGIKEMDTSLLKNVKRYKVIGNTEKVFWNVGMLRLLFKKEYQTYFMLFESRCITTWLFFWLAFKFFKKKRFYIWTHGWYGKENGRDAKMKLWLYHHVTGTFVYGERAKNLLIKKGVPENKLFAIHNSLDYDTQKALRQTLCPTLIYKSHFKNNNPTIIFIGRLTRVKKLNMIIDALADLRDKGEFYNLVFVGDGVEAGNLKAQAETLNLQKQVWFYGACYDEKINAELIYNADLCVSPGNVGLTAIHTMMFGCPVITHDDFEWQMPEYESIKDGITGGFFKMHKNNGLSTSISHWFAKKIDKREEVRQACFNEIDMNWNPYYQMEVIKNNLKVV